jgi:hypothetical protein
MIRRRSNSPPPAEWLTALRFDVSERPPAAARGRVLERLQADIAAGVVVPDLPPVSPGGSSGLAGAGARVIGRIATRANRLAVVMFALGAATGAALHAWLQHPRDRIVYLDRPVAAPQIVVPPAVPAAPPAPESGEEPANSVHKPLARSLPVSGARDLAAERALLDRVQRALRAGDIVGAQRAIDAHTRRFPTGILAEEREALAIKTLVAAGRQQEAQKRAAAFRERFPGGLFQPSIDEPAQSIP